MSSPAYYQMCYALLDCPPRTRRSLNVRTRVRNLVTYRLCGYPVRNGLPRRGRRQLFIVIVVASSSTSSLPSSNPNLLLPPPSSRPLTLTFFLLPPSSLPHGLGGLPQAGSEVSPGQEQGGGRGGSLQDCHFGLLSDCG